MAVVGGSTGPRRHPNSGHESTPVTDPYQIKKLEIVLQVPALQVAVMAGQAAAACSLASLFSISLVTLFIITS